MKKLPAIHFLLTFFLTAILYLLPIQNLTHAQSCDPNNPSCPAGLICADTNGEGRNYECREPILERGDICETARNNCTGSMVCVADSPGSTSGMCGDASEGSSCTLANDNSCGAFTTSPYACNESTQTCQGITCNPANGSADCKKPSFSCIQEGVDAYCKFEESVNKHINVRVLYHDIINVLNNYEREPFKVDLFLNDKIIKTAYTQKIFVPAKNKDSFEDVRITLSAKFEDVGAGQYEVCVPDGGLCQDVLKDSGKPGDPNPVVFRVEACAENKNKDSFLCEDPIAPPPPPCEFRDDEKCRAFNSAFGSLSTEPGRFISSIFGVLLALSGAIALLLIMRAGYKIMTSKGEPEKLKEGREQLIAAIVGLMFLIFALVFLELIGFGILKLPGFKASSSSVPISRDGSNPNNPDNSQDDPNGTNNPDNSNNLNNPNNANNPNNPSNREDPNNDTAITTCSVKLFRIGDSGECVKQIQNLLSIDPADGIYDARTDGAVRKFQAKQSIFTDGVVGPCTWGRFLGQNINNVCEKPLTENNIRQFQKENDLKIDGTLNSCTWNTIMGDPIPDSCRA